MRAAPPTGPPAAPTGPPAAPTGPPAAPTGAPAALTFPPTAFREEGATAARRTTDRAAATAPQDVSVACSAGYHHSGGRTGRSVRAGAIGTGPAR